MQIVIDIPESTYKYLAKLVNAGKEPLGYFERVIMRGTPLPKGHGDLKDVSKFIYDCDYGVCDKICRCDNCVHRVVREQVIKDAPAVIEADKEVDE